LAVQFDVGKLHLLFVAEKPFQRLIFFGTMRALVGVLSSFAWILHDRWPKLALDDKSKIAEAIVGKIVIGDGEIDLTL
jgi:hypothetical protein